jgi:hypothetical protein
MQPQATGSKLAVACVYGTSRVLRAEAQQFSPAAGLLLSLCSPQTIANLRSLPNCDDIAGHSSSASSNNLAKELFFQREDKQTGRRYGPVAIVGSKSQAAYWLNPKAMGRVIGLAISEPAMMVFAVSSKDSCITSLRLAVEYRISVYRPRRHSSCITLGPPFRYR